MLEIPVEGQGMKPEVLLLLKDDPAAYRVLVMHDHIAAQAARRWSSEFRKNEGHDPRALGRCGGLDQLSAGEIGRQPARRFELPPISGAEKTSCRMAMPRKIEPVGTSRVASRTG